MSLAKLTKLFTEGKELVLGDEDAGTQVVLWINKLSAFQEEQANSSARVARARRILAIKQVGTPEYELFQGRMAELGTDAIAEQIAESKSAETYLRIVDDLRADPQWRERIELIEHSDITKVTDEAERKLLEDLQAEYNKTLVERHDEELANLRDELKNTPPDELADLYRKTYFDDQGYQAFTLEKMRWQLYFSMRECNATPPPYGTKWDHSSCNHKTFFLDDVADVEQIPMQVARDVQNTYADLSMAPSLARFGAALSSSSASPEPSAAVEDSKDSGPEATSEQPATT